MLINEEKCNAEKYWRFLYVTVACMIPVFGPVMLYLRQKFGEKTFLTSNNSILIIGENKNEILRLEKEELLFIKAIENYVEICFMDKNKKAVSKTFRQTLSNISKQLPFLEKCHRSYLVNINNITAIIGNSQSAKLTFVVDTTEIPLSKTYFKNIKSCLL